MHKGRLPQSAASLSRLSPRCLWTSAEDLKLVELASQPGIPDWKLVALEVSAVEQSSCHPLKKTAKQCRERWHGHLDPEICKTPWTEFEESRLFALHKEIGNKWSEIAHGIPGRTDNGVKNFFFCKLRKMIREIRKGAASSGKNQELDLAGALKVAYMIEHLQRNYFEGSGDDVSEPKGTRSGKKQGDKYIIEVIRASELTPASLSRYLDSFISTLSPGVRQQLVLARQQQANDTEESSSLGKRLKPLPPLEEPLKKRSCSGSESIGNLLIYHVFLACAELNNVWKLPIIGKSVVKARPGFILPMPRNFLSPKALKKPDETLNLFTPTLYFGSICTEMTNCCATKQND